LRQEAGGRRQEKAYLIILKKAVKLLRAGTVDKNYLEKLARLDFQNLVDGKLQSTIQEMLTELQPTFRTSLSSMIVVCKFIAKGTHSGNKHPCFSDNTFCSTD
jgi:hypothetical protein